MVLKRDEELKPFPSTQWSLVARAGHASIDTQRQALSTLLIRYLPALRAYLLLERRMPRDRVEDLLQGFVTDQLLEHNLVAHVQREKGKFRSFVLLALKRYVISQYRKDTASKRSPEGGSVHSLDEEAMSVPDSAHSSPHFDVAWAKELVSQTLERMCRECEAGGREDIWGVFQSRMVGPLLEQTDPVEYAELAKAFQLPTALAAANLLTTGKRMFARALRQVVGEYAIDEREVQEEVVELMAVLGQRPA